VVLLLLPITLALALGCSHWSGLIGSDDLHYAVRAHRVWSERTPVAMTRLHDGRVVMYGLIGLSFSLFGVSEMSLAIVPLLSTAATAAALAVLGRQLFGRAVGLIAGAMYALFPLNVYYATVAVPEPITSLEMTLAAICFVRAKTHRGSAPLAVVAGLLAGLAYLTTEAGSLILPVLIAYGILMRYELRTLFSAAAGFLFIPLLETVHSYYQYGQPLARFTATAGRYGLDPMVVAANTDLFDRLLKAYSRYFIWPNEDFGAWGLVFLASIGLGLWRFRESALPLLWSGVLLAFFNFGSARLDRYVALPVATRLIMIALPPLFILTARLAVVSWHAVEIARGGTGWVAWLGKTLVIAGGVCLIAIGLVASDLAMNRGLLVAATRNARAIAEYFRDEDSLSIVSDATTLDIVRFYREFRARDRLIPFDKLTTSADQTPGLTGMTWVVLNGPIVNEAVISGSQYGRGVSLSEAASDVVVRLQSQNITPSVAFDWKDRRRWHNSRIVDPIVSLLHWKTPVREIALNAELAGIQAFRLPVTKLTGLHVE
jgi:hypothetical protein